jgi:hypothetical protein
MSIEAMKQALEALELAIQNGEFPQGSGILHNLYDTAKSMRQAIAELEKQEPVAWNGWVLREVYFEDGIPCTHREPPKREAEKQEPFGWVIGCNFYKVQQFHFEGGAYENQVAVYTHPPKREQETMVVVPKRLAYDTWAFLAQDCSPCANEECQIGLKNVGVDTLVDAWNKVLLKEKNNATTIS